jgi:flagellar biosynthesis/type III secretory pathway chaperone
MNHSQHELACQQELARLLEDLTQVQDELLDVLSRKRQCMSRGDRQGMAELQGDEERLCERLQECHDRRAAVLQQAGDWGLPVRNLGDLASVLKMRGAEDLRRDVKTASARMGLLRHNCLANWVLAQKALLHASQMLEIIASGGRLQATYTNRAGPAVSGALVDQEI